MVKSVYSLSLANESSNFQSYIILDDADRFFLLTTAPVAHGENIPMEGLNITSPTPSRLHPVNTPPQCTITTAVLAVEMMTGCTSSPLRRMEREPVSGRIVFTDSDFDLEPVRQPQRQERQTSVTMLPGYTQRDIYSGFGSYHSNQRSHSFNTPVQADKPWRIGIELELYANDRECYDKIIRSRSNWFQCEGDSSLNEASYAIEMKTIPLKACDAKSAEFWAEPMKQLSKLAKSKRFNSTGLHFHIGKEIFGNTETVRKENLAKLIYFYTCLVEKNPAAHAKNTAICGREYGYGCSSSTPDNVLRNFDDLIKRLGLDKVISISDEHSLQIIIDKLHSGNQSSRWDINQGNWNTYGTVEFRKGKGSISKMRLAGLATWWEQMVLYCNATAWKDLSFDAFFAKVTSENPAVAYWFSSDEEF